MLLTPTKISRRRFSQNVRAVRVDAEVRAASAGAEPANPGQGCVFRTKQSGIWKKVTDEVDESEIYGALPLSYGAAIKSCAGGTRTHDPRLLKHVLQFGSRSVLVF